MRKYNSTVVFSVAATENNRNITVAETTIYYKINSTFVFHSNLSNTYINIQQKNTFKVTYKATKWVRCSSIIIPDREKCG